MTALTKPDWTREGETWRVVEERHLRVANQDDEGDDCMRSDCGNLAVAVGKGRGSRLALCEKHLRWQRAWVEGNRVVSWVEGNRVVSWRLSK